MVIIAEIAALATFLIAAIAEILHARRCRAIAPLAFGPSRRPAFWTLLAPWLRALSVGALCWALTTLMLEPPKTHKGKILEDKDKKHVVLLLDVSPSMKLVDAGPEHKQSRTKRAAAVMNSFFQRVPAEEYLVSIIAVYNGSKPVVVDTKDMQVVYNVLDDLPLHFAFPVGKTDLFSGLIEAAKIAHNWKPKSAVLVMVTDGDSVPAAGLPKLPASFSDILIVGVGDPKVGSFIEGHQSRQDIATLRQLAVRLNGNYHDANEKQIPTTMLAGVSGVGEKDLFESLTKREYALILCGVGAAILGMLPILLHYLGTSWKPGVLNRAISSRIGDSAYNGSTSTRAQSRVKYQSDVSSLTGVR